VAPSRETEGPLKEEKLQEPPLILRGKGVVKGFLARRSEEAKKGRNATFTGRITGWGGHA